MSKKLKPFRLYSVIKGGLYNLGDTFDSIPECDFFVNYRSLNYDQKLGWPYNPYKKYQLVLQEYMDKSPFIRIVKLYN